MNYKLVLAMLMLTGCGGTSPVASSVPKAATQGRTNVSLTLSASLGVNDYRALNPDTSLTIPSQLDRSSGAGVSARAHLTFDGVECYYNSVPASSVMAFDTCTGSYTANDTVATTSVELVIEFGNVTTYVTVSGTE